MYRPPAALGRSLAGQLIEINWPQLIEPQLIDPQLIDPLGNQLLLLQKNICIVVLSQQNFITQKYQVYCCLLAKTHN